MSIAPAPCPVVQSVLGQVRALHVELPEPVVGALIFRVGVADEELPVRGITHLVEHLALFGIEPKPGFVYNGQVELDRTMLWARGAPSDVLDFLTRTSASLAELPLERLENERRVLLTEAAKAQRSTVHRLLALRYGAYGYGLGDFLEKGLQWLDGEHVQRWANERFCAQSAVCLLTAAPPRDYCLDLPHGEDPPLPPLDPLPELTIPSQVTGMPGVVAVSMLAERSWETVAGLAFATRRLTDDLRRDRGLTYSVIPSYVRLGQDVAHLTVTADALGEYAADVRNRTVDELTRLAQDGPAEDELADWQRGWDEMPRTEEELSRAELDRMATELLIGLEPKSFEELEATRRELTTAAIRETMLKALASGLLMVPPGTPGYARTFRPATVRPVPRPDGTAFRFKGRRFRPARQLVIGQGRVSLVSAEGVANTLVARDCVAAEHTEDGRVILCRRDGTGLELALEELQKPAAVLEALRAVLPVSCWIPSAPAGQ